MKRTLFLIFICLSLINIIFVNGKDIGNKSISTGNTELGTGNKNILTGDVKLGTGDKKVLTGDKKVLTGDKKALTGSTDKKSKPFFTGVDLNMTNQDIKNTKEVISRFLIIEKYLVSNVDKNLKNLSKKITALNDKFDLLKKETELTKKTKELLENKAYKISEKEKKLNILINNLNNKDKKKFQELISQKIQLENEKKALLDRISILTKELENKEITKQQLAIAIGANQKLQKEIEQYKKKIVRKEINAIFMIIFLYIILLILSSFLGKLFVDKSRINLETIRQVIMSVLTIFVLVFIFYKILKIYSQFFMILILVLSAIIISFRTYISSIIDFFTSIIFKYSIFEYVSITNFEDNLHIKFGQIIGLTPMTVKLKLFDEELNFMGYKTMFNSEFITKVVKLTKGMFYYKEFVFNIDSGLNLDNKVIEQIDNFLKSNNNIRSYNIGIIVEEDKNLLKIKIFLRKNDIYEIGLILRTINGFLKKKETIKILHK